MFVLMAVLEQVKGPTVVQPRSYEESIVILAA